MAPSAEISRKTEADHPASGSRVAEQNFALNFAQDFWGGFSRSFLRIAVDEPVESLEQLARHSVHGQKSLANMGSSKAPSNSTDSHCSQRRNKQDVVSVGSAQWHGEVWGSTTGALVPLMLVSGAMRGCKLLKASKSLQSGELLSLDLADTVVANHIRPNFALAANGALASVFFTPVSEKRDYVSAKLENALISAVSFTAMEGVASSRRAGRAKGCMTEEPWQIQATIPSISDYAFSGALTGLVQSETEAIVRNHRTLPSNELFSAGVTGLYSGAILGGGYKTASESAALLLKGPKLADVVSFRSDLQDKMTKDPGAQELLLELGGQRTSWAGSNRQNLYDMAGSVRPEYKLNTATTCHMLKFIEQQPELKPHERLEKFYHYLVDHPDLAARLARHPLRIYDFAMKQMGLKGQRLAGMGYESFVLLTEDNHALKMSYKPFHHEHGSRFFDEDIILREIIAPTEKIGRYLGHSNEYTCSNSSEVIAQARANPILPLGRLPNIPNHYVYVSLQPYGKSVVTDLLAFKFGRNLVRHGWDFKDPTANQLVYRDGMIRLVDSLAVAPLKKNEMPRFYQRAFDSMPALKELAPSKH